VRTETLFQQVKFVMHSGGIGHWKIECDALSDGEIECLALMLAEVLPPFGSVYGIPRGGARIARALERYAATGPVLIVDDVLTTGHSMEGARQGIAARSGALDSSSLGAVLFARGPCPGWITPLFRMTARSPFPSVPGTAPAAAVLGRAGGEAS
jgi:hypothetical protein